MPYLWRHVLQKLRGGTLGMEDAGKLCWKEVLCLNFEDWVERQEVERWKRDGARGQNLQGGSAGWSTVNSLVGGSREDMIKY